MSCATSIDDGSLLSNDLYFSMSQCWLAPLFLLDNRFGTPILLEIPYIPFVMQSFALDFAR